jgi:hypothetical protein
MAGPALASASRMTSSDAASLRPTSLERAVPLGVALLAVVQLVTAGWILVAPHSFFRHVGPFGVYNGHYLLDAAALTGGLGLALVASLRWPALQPGVLAAAAGMTGLHAINHWADVSDAHAGSSAGLGDAVSLTVLFAVTVVLARAALRARTS